ADAQCQVEAERAGWNHVNLHLSLSNAQAHDAAFSIRFGDGGNSGLKLALASRVEFLFFGGSIFSRRCLFRCFRRHNLLLRFRLIIPNAVELVNGSFVRAVEARSTAETL